MWVWWRSREDATRKQGGECGRTEMRRQVRGGAAGRQTGQVGSCHPLMNPRARQHLSRQDHRPARAHLYFSIRQLLPLSRQGQDFVFPAAMSSAHETRVPSLKACINPFKIQTPALTSHPNNAEYKNFSYTPFLLDCAEELRYCKRTLSALDLGDVSGPSWLTVVADAYVINKQNKALYNAQRAPQSINTHRDLV
jgi:hypothetical protein